MLFQYRTNIAISSYSGTPYYYAFGSAIAEMSYTSDTNKNYRYGFNGKEEDSSKLQDYGERYYEINLARFLSVDPLTKSYPMLTPYQFSSNNPISNIDLDGLEGVISSSHFANLGVALMLDNKTYKSFKDRFIVNVSVGVCAVSNAFFISNSTSVSFYRNTSKFSMTSVRDITSSTLIGNGENTDRRHDINFSPITSIIYTTANANPVKGTSFAIGYQITNHHVSPLDHPSNSQLNANGSGLIASFASLDRVDINSLGQYFYNIYSTSVSINNIFSNKKSLGVDVGVSGISININQSSGGTFKVINSNGNSGLCANFCVGDFKLGVYVSFNLTTPEESSSAGSTVISQNTSGTSNSNSTQSTPTNPNNTNGTSATNSNTGTPNQTQARANSVENSKKSLGGIILATGILLR